MNTLSETLFSFLTLLALFSLPQAASAYYDPGVQRWINRDPIGRMGGANLYTFVRGCPVASVDRDGRIPIEGPPPPEKTPEDVKSAEACSCYYSLWKQRRSIMGRARNEARNDPLYGGIGANEGPEDAIRHCLAGCYLARAMRAIPACKDVSPTEVITNEEKRRSNGSQTDIDNSAHGAGAPANADCQDYCRRAMAERKIRTERPPPWPVIQ
jgi:uncharacterized protein RhaS with RHS repeats